MELELSATHRAPARLAIFAALAYGAWAIAAIWTGPRNYRTNDDVAMQAIASGDLTGAPDARWVFTGPLTAWPITSLYRIADLPWYALAQYSLQILAGAAITTVLVRRHKASGSVVALVAIAVLIVLQYRMLVLLSFTGTAFVAGFAAIALWLDSCIDSDRRQRLVKVALAVAFFVCASSTRSDVVSALVVIALPGALLSWRLGTRWLTLIGVAPVITLFVNRTLTHAFTDAPYQDFLEYNAVRGSLHGTPRLSPESLPPDVLAEIGWSSSDRALFSSFIFDDWDLFGYDRLLRVADATASSRAHFTFDLLVDQVVLAYPGVFVALCVITATSLLQRRWLVAATQLATIGIAISAMTYLLITARLPERVSLPLWLGVVVVIAVIASLGAPDSKVENREKGDTLAEFQYLVIGLVALLAVLFIGFRDPGQAGTALPLLLCLSITAGAFILVSNDSRLPVIPKASFVGAALGFALFELLVRGPVGLGPSRAWAETFSMWYDDQVSFLEGHLDETTIIGGGSTLKVAGMDPLGHGTIFDGNNYISMGWWNFSPMYESRKALLPTSGSLSSMATDDSVLWFGSSGTTSYLSSYILREQPQSDLPRGLVSIGCAPLQPNTCLWQMQELEPGQNSP